MKTLYVTLMLTLLATSALAQQKIHYGGATTLQKGYMPEAAKQFKKDHQVTFKIQGGNSTPGLRLLAQDRLNLAGSGRFLTDQEKQQGLIETLVGWDALIPIVNIKNPIEDISFAQLQAIFSGKINDWQALGGPQRPIVVYTAPLGSGIRKAQQKIILEGQSFLPKERKTLSPAMAIPNVSAKPWSIAVISKSLILTQSHDRVKMLSVNGIRPSPKTIAEKQYTLVKPLFLVTKGKAAGKIKAFLDFTLSPDGQAIMDKLFFSIH